MPYQKEDEVVVGEYDLHDQPQGQLARWSQAYSHNTLTSGSDPWIRTTGRWWGVAVSRAAGIAHKRYTTTQCR